METEHTETAVTQAGDGAPAPPDLDQLRTFSYEVSEEIAPSWESHRGEIEAISAPVREWMLRELAPRPGETILELAAGVGDTGFDAARLIAEEGRLISTDFSPAMVAAARRRGDELGVANAEYRVADAEGLELEADSVDGAICRFGYMLMPDPARALSETRRVLRPGGRAVLAVWGAPERNPFFSILGMMLARGGHIPPPDPQGPGIFAMASGERTTELLERAGFTTARVEDVPVVFRLETIDEYLRFVGDTAGHIALAVRGLSDAERTRIGAGLEEAFAPFLTGTGYELPGVALVAVAS